MRSSENDQTGLAIVAEPLRHLRVYDPDPGRGEPGPMLVRKVEATFELWGHFVSGVIDTKEKYEKPRYDMAKKVWTRMKKTDSLECRNCHNDKKMSEDLQTEKARNRHAKGRAEGLTCIDCHFGIAHSEPEGPGPQELIVKK